MVRRRALLMMGALATAGGLVGLIATRDAPPKPAVFKPAVPTRTRPPGTRAPDARGAAAMPPWNIVTTVVVYTDPSRGTPARGEVQPQPVRNFETVIRWPVTPAGDLIPGRHPVVVFAHGYAVQTSTYAALLDDMAAAGMIVAAPELPGESAALLGSPNEADLVNEPCDFEFVAASLLAAPPPALVGRISHAPVVFAGHSDGATAAVAAGYQRHSCAGPSAAGVVALSGREVPIDRSASGPRPPLLAVTGTSDEINPAARTEQLWLDVPASATLLTVEGGTHLGTFTTDVDRAAVDGVIASWIRANTVDARAGASIVGTGRLRISTR